MDPRQVYSYDTHQKAETPPQYERVARGLTDAELEEEILGGKGNDGFRLAVLAEYERRAVRPPAEPTRSDVREYDADEWEAP